MIIVVTVGVLYIWHQRQNNGMCFMNWLQIFDLTIEWHESHYLLESGWVKPDKNTRKAPISQTKHNLVYIKNTQKLQWQTAWPILEKKRKCI